MWDGQSWLQAATYVRHFRGRGRLSDYGIRFVWSFWPFEAESAFDVWDRLCQEFTCRLAHYHKVHCKDKELSRRGLIGLGQRIAVCSRESARIAGHGPALPGVARPPAG